MRLHIALAGFLAIVPALGTENEQNPLTDSSTSKSGLLSLHKSLVEIESITLNEHKVGEWLAHYLQSHLNLTVHKQSVAATPGSTASSAPHSRFNIYAHLGSSQKAHTLITSHIDTVPPFWPYEVRNHGTEIWGRGSVDAKGSVAAQIQAFAELQAAGKLGEGDAALLFVVGEETSGGGMRRANDLGLTWEAVVFGEPTEGKLAAGHKGTLGVTIRAKGMAAHSGYPWLGLSANNLLLAALAGVLGAELPSSDKFGQTTVNIGKIEGGVAANVVAAEAEALVMLRIAAGTPEDCKTILLEAMHNATKGMVGSGGALEVDFSAGYGPIDIDHDVEGFDTITVNYGTDIPNLKGDHKRYLYGPGSILVAHSDHEHLAIKDLQQAVVDYKKIIMATLDKSGDTVAELQKYAL